MDRLPIRIGGNLARRNRRPARKMLPLRHGDSEIRGRVQIKSRSVYSRLLARNLLSLHINNGIGNGRPVRVQRKRADVFVPPARNGNVQSGIKNHLTRTVFLREIPRKMISGPDRNRKAIRPQLCPVGDGYRSVGLRTSARSKGNHGHGLLPHGIERNAAPVFRTKIGDLRAVTVHDIPVLRKCPADKGMPRPFKRISGKETLRTECELPGIHGSLPAVRLIGNRIGICLPHRIKQDILTGKDNRISGVIFLVIGVSVRSPADKSISGTGRLLRGNPRCRAGVICRGIRKHSRTPVCRINQRKLCTVRNKNMHIAPDGNGVLAVFPTRNRFAVDIYFRGSTRHAEGCRIVKAVAFLQSDNLIAFCDGRGDGILRGLPNGIKNRIRIRHGEVFSGAVGCRYRIRLFAPALKYISRTSGNRNGKNHGFPRRRTGVCNRCCPCSAVRVIGKRRIVFPDRIQRNDRAAHRKRCAGIILRGVRICPRRPAQERVILAGRNRIAQSDRFFLMHLYRRRRAGSSVRIVEQGMQRLFLPCRIEHNYVALYPGKAAGIRRTRVIHCPILFIIHIPAEKIKIGA